MKLGIWHSGGRQRIFWHG